MTIKTRIALLAAVTIVGGGCNGWPDAIEFDAAAHKPEKYQTYAAAPAEAVPIFVAEHHRYMIMPTSSNLRLGRTRQVGTATGVSVFALEGDDAPFANLFAQAPDGSWRQIGIID